MPQENGKFSQDLRHLPPARPAARGRRGRAVALTWHTKPPHTSGGRRCSQVQGPRCPARQWEIPAAPEPRADPPQAAFSPPPAAPRAPRWRRLGARGPAAGAGRSWWQQAGLEGGREVPGRGGDSPTGALSPLPVPGPGLPAAASTAAGPPGIALCK
jgi:hypothetical protein